MRLFSMLLMTGWLTGCAAITATPWDWLDDPSQQQWKEVVINGFGREIRFSVPDRLKKGGQHVITWPQWDKGQDVLTVNLGVESLTEPYLRPVWFDWDWYWIGPFRGSQNDFGLAIKFTNHSDEFYLLDLSLDERVERQWQYYKEYYQDAPIFNDYFFEHYWIRTYINPNGVEFIVENQPQTQSNATYYMVPISDHHELELIFFVRDKRWGRENAPEWNQSRWDIVEKIVETVQITPNPHN